MCRPRAALVVESAQPPIAAKDCQEQLSATPLRCTSPWRPLARLNSPSVTEAGSAHARGWIDRQCDAPMDVKGSSCGFLGGDPGVVAAGEFCVVAEASFESGDGHGVLADGEGHDSDGDVQGGAPGA